ncbi:Cyclin PHO80-like protein [Kalmanozyma brasiliensis GHG001]|uniref:Cyclin n=1 Tax=Kalmanozyma brasiliensis (strain GHG001) TaxID=1365824 RepID=V5GR06_KALBG|nr:Cyclin PHO80-like protein [Kalmanozyma brasiliensis GHG001]EST08377.1 Cyclin PHO80-like protein [Kalmanozyma brasiliensis GHG001]
MVYVAQPHSALPIPDAFAKDLSCDNVAFFGKENWPRSQKQAGKQPQAVASIACIPFPSTTDSDHQVEAAPAKSSQDDADLKSSTSVSDWCAQMVCYIWFSGIDSHEPNFSLSAASSPASRAGRLSVTSSPPATHLSAHKRHSKKLSLGSLSEAVSFSVRDLHNAVEAHARSAVESTRSRPSASERSNDPRLLRLFPRRRFTDFVRNMLNTTQVSKSVIILALLYIHRLKSKNPGLRGQEGSEFRLFVTALMLANKFLDDHTYTNKTWSELSGLKLKDVTKMEIEFWLGLSSNIHASDADFRSWIGTLEVLAERRQLALSAHEAEKLRQAALRQQGFVQHAPARSPLQAPVLASIYDAPRRIAHNSRVSQSRSWSPEQLALDARPRSSPATAATSHLSHVYAPAPAPIVPRFDLDASVQAIMNNAGYPTPASSSVGASSPTGVSQLDVCTGSKRGYAQHDQTSPLSETRFYHTPSPERSNKRRQMGDDRALQAFTSGARNYGLSPPFAQPCPRSVFEPLVSTPNTLLAPYVMQQQQAGAGTMLAKHQALAYWQLAAGHDRGILGLHMPAPQDYFHWHQLDHTTTAAYPTPPIEPFQYARPHAPFNNAETHYVDPLFIRY